MIKLKSIAVSIVQGILLLAPAVALRAADVPANSTNVCPVMNYFDDWFTRVAKSQAEQPHWAPPVATTSPLLQEVFRYDIMQQKLPGGHTLTIYGGSKGLEFIPADRLQFIVALPAWETEDTTPNKNGWGDQNFLVKYRLLAGNEEEGDYVLTLFGGLSVPTGDPNYTLHRYVFTPTVAFGKGWGDLDFQSTISASIPDNAAAQGGAGTPLLANAVLQYRFQKVLWPEVEANYTYWPDGMHEGMNQLFITPGLALGKFPIWRRFGVACAVGCQLAVTDKPLYHRNFIFSARFPF